MRAFAFAVVAAGLAILAADSSAQVNSKSRCGWVTGVYRCYSTTETPHSITRTLCGSGGIDAACTSKTIRKKPPGPPPAPTTERSDTGVLIMRGGPR